jgi:hypothetical protein
LLQREYDQDGWFAAPVAEIYPAMADNYLSVVSEPMDFRTIEELRLEEYADISELQDDLILTFKNVRIFSFDNQYCCSSSLCVSDCCHFTVLCF